MEIAKADWWAWRKPEWILTLSLAKSHLNAKDTVRVIEGSLETKVPTIWTDEKQHSQEEAEPGRNSDV